MSLLTGKRLLNVTSRSLQAVRFRGKINVQKPRKPHFERALFFEVSKPIFLKPPEIVQREAACFNEIEKIKSRKQEVENPLQRIYAQELLDRFQRSKLIVFFHKNSISGETEFHALAALHKIGMEYKVYGKKTLEMAILGTPYEAVLSLFMSHTACAFTTQPDIKKLLKVNKKYPQLIILAAVYENKFISKDELVKFSNIPNLETARCQLVQTLSGVGSQLVTHLNTNQQILLSQFSERTKQLENK